jgi:protein-disulfide isomerase
LENEIVFGSPNAPVTMVEYSSYSCPHCARFQKQTLPKIMENYVETGQVRLVIRRVSSPALSVAAVCADKQREFKEIDNYLFENVDDLHREVEGIENQNRIQNIVSGWVEKMAKDTGINESQFRQCLNSEDSLKTVRHWLDKVEKKQIDATPAFFVNDRQISGNQQYFKFEQVIEQALQL